MCGRYHQHKPREALELMFDVGRVLDDSLSLAPRYNIAPTQRAPVIRATDAGEPTLAMLNWGLVPSWTKAADAKAALREGARLINARSETVPTKPSFRDAARKRRCLVPATGFYEWRAGDGGATKQPFNLTPAEGVFFAFGGLWARWTPPDAPTAAPGADALETFTILTTAANADLADLHDRMPLLIPRSAFARWLDPAVTDLDALTHLVVPAPGGSILRAPANPRVNAVRNEGPELLSPPAPPPPAQPLLL